MRCKLREIARLLINYRIDSNDENAKLEDCINPTKFRLLLTSVKKRKKKRYNMIKKYKNKTRYGLVQ